MDRGEKMKLPDEIKKDIIPKEINNTYENISTGISLMGEIFNSHTYNETPEEFIESRVIGRDKAGNEIYADYIRQFYVIRELNRLYPGWSLIPAEVPLFYQPETRTWQYVGSLKVRYYDIITKKLEERIIPGIGSIEVQFKREPLEGETFLRLSRPDDMAKGARTECIKNAAYWLGIGFDVYSQEITPKQMSQFEDTIRTWEQKDYVLAVANSIKRKKAFQTFIDSLPNVEQTAEFHDILKDIPRMYAQQLWDDYQRQTNISVVNWLEKLKMSKIYKKIYKKENKNVKSE